MDNNDNAFAVMKEMIDKSHEREKAGIKANKATIKDKGQKLEQLRRDTEDLIPNLTDREHQQKMMVNNDKMQQEISKFLDNFGDAMQRNFKVICSALVEVEVKVAEKKGAAERAMQFREQHESLMQRRHELDFVLLGIRRQEREERMEEESSKKDDVSKEQQESGDKADDGQKMTKEEDASKQGMRWQ